VSGRLKRRLKKRSIFIDTAGVLGIISAEDVVNDVGKFYNETKIFRRVFFYAGVYYDNISKRRK